MGDCQNVLRNITELVFELATKEQWCHEMKSKVVQSENAYLVSIAQLEEKLRLEPAQHTEQSMLQKSRIHELAKLLQHEESEVQVGCEGSGDVLKPVVRRRRVCAKGKASVVKTEDDEQTGVQGNGPLPRIEEEM